MKFLVEENFLPPCPPLGKVFATFPHQKSGNNWIKVMKVHHWVNLHQFLYSELHMWESIDYFPPSIYLKISLLTFLISSILDPLNLHLTMRSRMRLFLFRGVEGG